MPRPPILPTLDWNKTFEAGFLYREWIEQAEVPEKRAAMEGALEALVLLPEVAAALAAMTRTVRVFAIAEDWCGDVVRHVPVLEKMARAANGRIDVRYVPRALQPDVFLRFLTNGGEAIPKFVFLNDAFVECGNWGPMPEDCRRLIARGKAANDIAAARAKVKALYEADPHCHGTQRELLAMIETASCTAP